VAGANTGNTATTNIRARIFFMNDGPHDSESWTPSQGVSSWHPAVFTSIS
jgi:hypothetical protein